MTQRMPTDRSPESTLALLREGYLFGSRRFERLDSDVFHARLLLRPTIFMRGRDAAELFYDSHRFARHGALPIRVQKTLVGQGGVQSLDGAAHLRRKEMLLSLMTPQRVTALAELFGRRWREELARWRAGTAVVVQPAVAELLCRSVFEWAGVPLPRAAVGRRLDQLEAMIAGPVAVGPTHWLGRLSRANAEDWLGALVTEVREGTRDAPPRSALAVIAAHRDQDGRLLDPRTAAVELLNVLRPTVAVDRYVTFLALALHEHPDWAAAMRPEDDRAGMFVQEVRRLFPFFPVTGAVVRHDFDWRGMRFAQGSVAVLDLFATNRHPRWWPEPGRFLPERFRDRPADPYDLVPQGGGEHLHGHRCAGEWLTIALLRTAFTALTEWMTYRVPPQNLTVPMNRLPTVPRSGFVITDVRPA